MLLKSSEVKPCACYGPPNAHVAGTETQEKTIVLSVTFNVLWYFFKVKKSFLCKFQISFFFFRMILKVKFETITIFWTSFLFYIKLPRHLS